MTINNLRIKPETDHITINTDWDIFTPMNKFQGCVLTNKLDFEAHLSKIASIINHGIHRAAEIKKYMSKSCHMKFSNAFLLSVLSYGYLSCLTQVFSNSIKCTNYV